LLFLRERKAWKGTRLTHTPMAGWRIKGIGPACSIIFHYYISIAAPSAPPARHLAELFRGRLQRLAPPTLKFKGLRARRKFPVPAPSVVHWR